MMRSQGGPGKEEFPAVPQYFLPLATLRLTSNDLIPSQVLLVSGKWLHTSLSNQSPFSVKMDLWLTRASIKLLFINQQTVGRKDNFYVNFQEHILTISQSLFVRIYPINVVDLSCDGIRMPHLN